MAIYTFECPQCGPQDIIVNMGTEETACMICGAMIKKDFNASAQFSAHGLPNGFCGSRASKAENIKAKLQ